MRLLLALVAVGYGLRLVLWLATLGTNDITLWYTFAVSVRDIGLEATYARVFVDQPGFNHPPLMGYLAAGALAVTEATGLSFARVFKVPALLAEVGTGLLLYRLWRDREGSDAGLLALAVYALSLSTIMISGYHGNTDAVYFVLAFAAAYLMEERQAPFLAGLALGAALNVKLIPVVIVLPVAARCMRPRQLARYASGTAVGILPFLWAWASFAPAARRAFVEGVFLYRSYREYWGVELAVRWSQALIDPVAPTVGYLVRIAGNLYGAYGGALVMVASAGLAYWHVSRTRREGRPPLDTYGLVALGFLIFLLFGPGFGAQYVGCVVAPLIATNVRRGAVVATVTGVFITALYAYFVVDWSPIYSVHGQMPAWFTPLSLLAWGVLFWAGRDLLRRATIREPAPPAELGRMHRR